MIEKKPMVYNLLWFCISFGIGTCLAVLIMPFDAVYATLAFCGVSLITELAQPDYILYGVYFP